MRRDPRRWLAALAASGALLTATPACAEDSAPEPELAAQLINDLRQRVAGCGATLGSGHRSDALPVSVPVRQPLTWNSRLAAAAEEHSQAMAEQAFFDHVDRAGRRVAQRADAAGYRWRSIGENLAAGHRTLQEALRGWLRSEGHCRNLLDERFTDFGLARVVSQRPDDRFRVYWTLVLARPAVQVVRTASTN